MKTTPTGAITLKNPKWRRSKQFDIISMQQQLTLYVCTVQL